MKKSITVILFWLLSIQAYSNEKRIPAENFSTSIIIPCHHAHFHFLSPLIDEYTKQTKLPDEIVISLSNSHLLPKEDIEKLKNQTNLFPVYIITQERKVSAGENRNIACEAAKGDILICNDADDIPHLQRVETIKYFFDNYLINHLAHKLIPNEELRQTLPGSQFIPKQFETYNIPDIKIITATSRYYNGDNFVHNGNIAITKQTAKNHKWLHVFGKDRDVQFNQKVCREQKSIILDAYLVNYQYQYSSFTLDRKAQTNP